MKGLLFLCSLLPVAALAQKAEIGITYGLSINASPAGNIYYVGDRFSVNNSFAIYCLGNVNTSPFQVGGGVFGLELANYSSKVYTYFGTKIGNNGQKFEYANLAYSIRPVLNYKLKKTKVYELYVGASAGPCLSHNEKQTQYNSDGSRIDFRGIDGGLGFTSGFHAGINRNFLTRMALTIEASAQYYYLSFVTSGSYPTGTNVHFSTMAFPVSIGIKYKMGYAKVLNYKTGKLYIPKVNAKKKEIYL